MNTKHLLLAATAAVFVTLNFTSCKEDEFDLSFENCVAKVSPISIKWEKTAFEYIDIDNIDTINVKRVRIYGASAILKNGMNDVKGSTLTYIGTSKNNLKPLSDYIYDRIELQPFATYYIESTPYIVHKGDTVYGEKKELKFYSIPKHELVLTADYGDGEIAANIHWKLKYYYESEDKVEYVGEWMTATIRHNYYDYDGIPTAVNVNLITSYDTTYNKGALDFPVDVDSCYIKQGGTRENPDYPAYICRYWKDGKTIMYYDPVIYDFRFNIKIPLGEEEFSVKDTIRSILMDKSNCTCDWDFNIYRIAKIGNKVWTIDDYRGSTRSSSTGKPILHGEVIDFYGYDEYLYNPMYQGYGDSKYIKGYHEANEEDWKDLMAYFGINLNADTLKFLADKDNIFLKLEKADTSLSHYFTNNGSVQELFSVYGWTDTTGNLTETYQGVFNAIPKGNKDNSHYGQGKYAFFRFNSIICYIISKDYGGIARGYSWHEYGSIRFVKD